MIQTAVDVVNLALVKLGSQLVANLDPPAAGVADRRTPLERRAALIYPHQRDRELSMRRWRFALRRAVVQPLLPSDPAFPYPDPNGQAAVAGWYYAPLPAACIRPLRDANSEWQQEGNYLATGETAAFPLLFIARVVETLFAPTFAEALSAKIAEQLAEFLTQSNEKKDRAQAMYTEAIREARLVNAYETGAEAIAYDDASCSFLTGRYAAGDGWGVTDAVGPYAGVRGDLAAVPPGVDPNPVPGTVVANSDNSIPTTIVYVDRPGSTAPTPGEGATDVVVTVDGGREG